MDVDAFTRILAIVLVLVFVSVGRHCAVGRGWIRGSARVRSQARVGFQPVSDALECACGGLLCTMGSSCLRRGSDITCCLVWLNAHLHSA